MPWATGRQEPSGKAGCPSRDWSVNWEKVISLGRSEPHWEGGGKNTTNGTEA